MSVAPEAVDAVVAAPAADARDSLPPLAKDASFLGMTATQFLGAFNDNLFKQMVLLFLVAGGSRFDPKLAQAAGFFLFAIPFVLFSGFAGWLADRYSKRSIIVLCKVAEIAIMAAGMVAFYGDTAAGLLIVLFFMGAQSAYFGPSKYGILPELVRDRDLPPANGVIQMTTFAAIILGTAVAGETLTIARETGTPVWQVNGLCVLIAVVGTLTAFPIRHTPIAHAGLPFEPAALVMTKQTRQVLLGDRPLLSALLVNTVFWFLGALVLMTVNDFGVLQMEYTEAQTARLLVCINAGIAAGCIFAGRLSRGRVRFGLVTAGAIGIAAFQVATAIVPFLGLSATMTEWLLRITLLCTGIATGLFAVPLAVFIQARPPADQKGRMIAAMNLFNWVGIVFAPFVYLAAAWTLGALSLPVSLTFVLGAVLILPVAFLYRPKDEALGERGAV
ncbi:MAG: MFS transporter [Planctomycetaceae bacterium]